MRAILFDVQTNFAQNAGVMVGWIALSCGTVVLFTWWMRKREVAALLADETTSIRSVDRSRHASREQVNMHMGEIDEEKKL